MIETYRGAVRSEHLDHMGHMNVQWYVSKFDEATWRLFRSVGITIDYINANKKGMAALEQNIKYKAEARLDDPLVIQSDVREIKNKTIRFAHTMYHAETTRELAVTEIIAVHLDLEARKSCVLPDEIKQLAARFIKPAA